MTLLGCPLIRCRCFLPVDPKPVVNPAQSNDVPQAIAINGSPTVYALHAVKFARARRFGGEAPDAMYRTRKHEAEKRERRL